MVKSKNQRKSKKVEKKKNNNKKESLSLMNFFIVLFTPRFKSLFGSKACFFNICHIKQTLMPNPMIKQGKNT